MMKSTFEISSTRNGYASRVKIKAEQNAGRGVGQAMPLSLLHFERAGQKSERDEQSAYVQLVDRIFTESKKKAMQIIGFTGVTWNQGTSKVVAMVTNQVAERLKLAPVAHGSRSPLRNTPSRNGSRHSNGRMSTVRNDYRNGDVMMDNYRISHDSSLFRSNGSSNGNGLHLAYGSGSESHDQDAGGPKGVFLIDGHWEAFAPYLDQLRQRKQFIFVDIPPVLQHPKSLSMCQYCDAVVLVVRANHARREVVNESKRLLENIGVPILGSILTGRKFYVPSWLYRFF